MNIAVAGLAIQSITLLVNIATLLWMIYTDRKKK